MGQLAMQDPSQGLTFCQAQGHKVTATVLGSEMGMEQQLHHVLEANAGW